MTPEQGDNVERATDRFWDEIALSRAGDPLGVDRGDIIAIRYLHDHFAVPGPAPAFAKGLRAELMHAHTPPVSIDSSPPVLPNGRVLQQPRPFPSPTARPALVRRWPYLSLAVAILLLLAGGVAGYRVFGPDGNGSQPAIPAIVAPAATPASTATPSPVAENDATLVEIDLPAGSLPRDAYGSTFDHRTMPPSSRTTAQDLGAFQLNYVISGQVTISSDGPLRLLRTADRSWHLIPAGTAVTLDAGDSYFLDSDAAVTLVNLRSEPVEFIAWSMTEGGGGNSEAPEGWSVHDNAAIHLAVLDRLDNPTRVQLRRVELSPGEELPPPSSALLYQTVFLGVNAAGETVAPVLGLLADDGQRNAGRQSLTIYELIVEPVPAGDAPYETNSPTA